MALTAKELKVLNALSQSRDASVLLGTLLNERSVPTYGTPVKGVKASKALTISGVVIDGETVTVNNPAKNGTDVYEFLADATQSKTSPGNIAVNIETHTVHGVVTLTVDTQPTVGDHMTIGSKVYTFVQKGTANDDGEISVGDDLAEAQGNIEDAINGDDGHNDAHPAVFCGNFASDDAVITALVGGTVGNIASTETFTAETNVFSSATLINGANCSAQNAIDHLVAAITASDTQGVGAVDSTGGVVTFSADAEGVAGNDIAIGETMANGAFAGGATKLSGGVDGTPMMQGLLMVDASYLYVCIGTVDALEWRRIALGSAY